MKQLKHGNLMVWWIPQVPGTSFKVAVLSVEEAVKIMDTLASYDNFQFVNKIKPDYSNAGGLLIFDAGDTEDSPEGSWVDWEHDADQEYFDNPREYLEYVKNKAAPNDSES